jgi:hypothetical protein
VQTLIIFLLGTAGFTIIVTMSSLFRPVRELFNIGDSRRQDISDGLTEPTARDKRMQFFYKIITCPLCFGIYGAAIMYFVMMIPTWGYFTACVFAGSITSFAIAKLVD